MSETSGDGGQRGSQSLLRTYVGVLGVRKMSHSSSSVLWLLLGRVTEYWLVGRRMNQGRPGGVVEYQYTRKKNRQNTPKYPKFLQIYPKIIEALNTLYPKLEVSETNTYLVVLPFLAFLQMDCHYFPTITDLKKRPHVSLNGKMVGYGYESLSS